MRGRKQIVGVLLTAMMFVAAGCVSQTEKSGSGQEESSLVIHEEEIEISGLEEEFEIIFLSDTHISLCDERDASLLEKAASRYNGFRNADGEGADVSFQSLMNYVSQKKPELLILGGDIVDSAMWASIEFVKDALTELQIPWIYEMGNHDFEYGGEYFSEKAYTDYFPRFSNISDSKNGFQLVEYEKFVVLAVDDKSNQVCEEAVKALEKLYEKEKPVILVMHVPIEPLTDSTLTEETKRVWKPSPDGHSRVLLGPHSCYPNETTQKFLDLVLAHDSPVELVLAGHIHFYHRDNLTDKLVQVVTGAGYQKELVKITLKSENNTDIAQAAK